MCSPKEICGKSFPFAPRRRPPDFDLGVVLWVPHGGVVRGEFQMKRRRAGLGERREPCGAREGIVKIVVGRLRGSRSCEVRSGER